MRNLIIVILSIICVCLYDRLLHERQFYELIRKNSDKESFKREAYESSQNPKSISWTLE